jgi:hypothetical protein
MKLGITIFDSALPNNFLNNHCPDAESSLKAWLKIARASDKRPITAQHARNLGKIFSVDPGVFI